MWYHINRFHLCAFVTWQIVEFYATQNIFSIYSNNVPKWSCGGSVPSNNCTIYRSCLKEELKFVNVIFESTAMEFNWICDDVYNKWFMYQVQFFGVLLGTVFFGSLSDQFGRKPIGILIMSIAICSTFCSGLAPTFHVLIALRFLVGFSIGGMLVVIGAWIMEVILAEQRMVLRGVFNWGWSRVMLCAICYSTREWRLASFLSSICLLPALFSVVFILPESPTWLHSKGRMTKMAKSEKHIANVAGLEYVPVEHKKLTPKTFLQALKTKGLLGKLIPLWIMWLIVAICGYANDLNSNQLDGDLYLNQLMFGILIALSKFLLLFVDTHCKSFKRRTLHQGSQFLTLLCFLTLITFMYFNYRGVWVLVINILGTTLIEYTWDACYLCATELMETSTRASATGSCSMLARVGSILAPFLNYANTLWAPAVYVTVVVLSTISLTVSYYFLPESKNVDLDDVHTDEIEEQLPVSVPMLVQKFNE